MCEEYNNLHFIISRKVCIAFAAGQTDMYLNGTPIGFQTITPFAEVTPDISCTGTHTKPSFCNDDVVCDATGIIVSV